MCCSDFNIIFFNIICAENLNIIGNIKIHLFFAHLYNLGNYMTISNNNIFSILNLPIYLDFNKNSNTDLAYKYLNSTYNNTFLSIIAKNEN